MANDLSITSLSINADSQPPSDLLQQPGDVPSVAMMPTTNATSQPISILQNSQSRQDAKIRDHISQAPHCSNTDNTQTSSTNVRFNINQESPRQAAQTDMICNPRTAFRLTGRKATPFLARKASTQDEEEEGLNS